MSAYNERFSVIASLAKLVLPCSLTLTPQNQPHSKTTANAVHLLFANAHAQHRKGEIDKNKKKKAVETPAYNERFCVIAAVTPLIMQCKLASYYPAGSSVEAATTQSRPHVSGNFGGQCVRT